MTPATAAGRGQTCDLRCENANPLNPCTCAKCKGACHGSRRIRPSHAEDLAHRALLSPKLTPDAESFWLGVLFARPTRNRPAERRRRERS